MGRPRNTPKKKAGHAEVVRLFVTEGIHDAKEIADRTGYCHEHVLRIIRWNDARNEYKRRVAKAERLYTELEVRNPAQLASLTGLSESVLHKEVYSRYPIGGVPANPAHIPALKTAGALLVSAGEQLLRDASTTGFAPETVKTWLALANAFEQFRTGEYLIEMVLVGIDAFAEYLRELAGKGEIDSERILIVVRLLDGFRKQQVALLEEQTLRTGAREP